MLSFGMRVSSPAACINFHNDDQQVLSHDDGGRFWTHARELILDAGSASDAVTVRVWHGSAEGLST